MRKSNNLLKIITRAVLAAVVSALMNSFALATNLSEPVTFGSPNQTFGIRRPVTAADKALISTYRSSPSFFSTTFASPDELQSDWTAQKDDLPTLKSCRRAGNVQASNAGARFATLVATDCAAHWSTGSIASKAQYGYGLFEATMKIADIKGMNNAFWLTTQDHYEIDVGEVEYPNYSHLGLQFWPTSKDEKHAGVGFAAKFTDNLFTAFHEYGVLWTPKELIFEV